MPTTPGAAVPDLRLFITRTAEPFRNLYERSWDGEEWLWIDHGRPDGVPVASAPGGAMRDKLFVAVMDGRLFERVWTGTAWAWNDHGTPPGAAIVAPGVALDDTRLFATAGDGRVFERLWTGSAWAWRDHAAPPGTRAIFEPAAAWAEAVWVTAENGRLFQLAREASGSRWIDHDCPPGTRVATAPLPSPTGKVFVGAADGRLFERLLTPGRAEWVDHGRPPGTDVGTAPGALRPGKFWLGARDGRLFERLWNGTRWEWVDHGRPPGTDVATAPGAVMPGRFFAGTRDERMFERQWDGARWNWIDHGTLRHDSAEYVLDNRAPGRTRLTIAVMAEGYREPEIERFRSVVRDRVDELFRQDLFADLRTAFNVVRLDVMSIESGVTEQHWDEGPTGERGDDTLRTSTPRNSRLGVIYTGQWSRCWIEGGIGSDLRIQKLLDRFAPEAGIAFVVLNRDGTGGCADGGFVFVTQSSGWPTWAHELGHQMGLADEYVRRRERFTGVAYSAPNCSQDPSRPALPWADLVAAGTPLPTDPIPGGWDDGRDVGAFEGCGTFAFGLFRPARRCRMDNNAPPFCPVCARTVRRFLEGHL